MRQFCTFFIAFGLFIDLFAQTAAPNHWTSVALDAVILPPTAERLQVRDIDDPRDNIFGGVRYLRILANNFNGDLELTVAGYNAGEEAVMRYGGIPPYQQTRDYVVKVVAYYRRYRTTVDVVEASML